MPHPLTNPWFIRPSDNNGVHTNIFISGSYKWNKIWDNNYRMNLPIYKGPVLFYDKDIRTLSDIYDRAYENPCRKIYNYETCEIYSTTEQLSNT